MALEFPGIDTMAWSKDLLDNPKSAASITAHMNALCRDFPAMGYIGTSIPMNTNVQAVAARGTNFAIEPATYAARFLDAIHANGRKVIFRGTDCAFEGIYSFSKGSLRNGNRYTFFGDSITDNFSSSSTRTHGYGATSAAGNLSTNYLTSHQSGNSWSIVSDELTGPASNGWVRTCLYNAASLRDVTIVAKVKKIGNQQIIVRATTDQNFPGYGLQMRDSTVLRIERPGLANLAEISSKSWVSNNWYWMKLEATGTTIRGKAWAADDATYPNSTDGSENEPVDWDLSTTDSNHTNGYCGFSGETSNGKFKFMKITPAVDTATWIYRSCDWIRTNISMFADGDQVVPFPEASSHQNLANQGSYNQFFLDLRYIIERIGTENGKALVAKHFSHIWTSCIQQSYNTQFTSFGIATYDHYGASNGLGKRFASFIKNTSAAANTYTVPTSIVENATNRCEFYPEKLAYNHQIEVWVVDKGTGDWTMTIHDGSNNLVQMCSQFDYSQKTTTGTVTIPNASLTNGQMNVFSIEWDNLPDVLHHFHLTSTVGDGTIKVVTAGDLNTAYAVGYKPNAEPKALEIDIRKTYARTGVPQYLQEWGDYWSTDSGRSTPVRNQTEHEEYLQSMYAMFQRLIDDGILVGFQYWRAIGAHEAVYQVAGNDTIEANYSRTYEGDILNDFFNANADPGSLPQGPTSITPPVRTARMPQFRRAFRIARTR